MARNEELRLDVVTRVTGEEQVDKLADDLDRVEGTHRADVKVEDHGAAKQVDKLGDSLEGVGKKGGLLGNLKGIFSAVGSEAKSAAGSLGPLGSVLGAIPGPIAAIGAGVGGAVVGLAKMASGFTDLALAADKFARTSGLSVEEASRWIAVADDIGVGADDVAKAFDRMQKSIGTGVLDKLGLSDLKGADATASFVNIAGHLQSITDETERAAEASAIFGKGWTSVSELLMSDTGTITEALGQVSDAQVINPEEVAKAKQYRKAMDDLGDSFSDIGTTIGEAAVPALANFAEGLAKIVSSPAFGQVLNVLKDVLDISGQVAGGVATILGAGSEPAKVEGLQALTDTLSALKAAGVDSLEAYDAYAKSVNKGVDLEPFHEQARTAVEVRDGMAYAAKAQAEYDAKTRAAAKSTEDAAKAEADRKKGLEDLLKATQDATDAQRDYADLNRALPALLADQTKAIEEANKAKGKDAELNEKAVDTNIKVADSIVKQAEAQAKANGTTLSASKSQELWNASMLESASRLSGPVQKSVLDYIADVNKIPPEKVSEIQAAIDKGDLDTAKRLLNEASATRTATINAEARNIGTVEQQLDYLARDRTVDLNVIARTVGVAFDPSRAGLPAGFVPASATAGATFVTVNMPPGSNGRDVVAAQTRHTRRNGGFRG